MTEAVDETKVVDTSADFDSSEVTPKEEKLHSIMEAANALTALGDEDDLVEGSSDPTIPASVKLEEPTVGLTKEEIPPVSSTSEQKSSKEDETSISNAQRFLPEHKKPDSAPTFPEKVRDEPQECHFSYLVYCLLHELIFFVDKTSALS
jgi:hypothetical protein